MFFQGNYSTILILFATIEKIFGEGELMVIEAQDLQKIQHKNVPYSSLTVLPVNSPLGFECHSLFVFLEFIYLHFFLPFY